MPHIWYSTYTYIRMYSICDRAVSFVLCYWLEFIQWGWGLNWSSFKMFIVKHCYRYRLVGLHLLKTGLESSLEPRAARQGKTGNLFSNHETGLIESYFTWDLSNSNRQSGYYRKPVTCCQWLQSFQSLLVTHCSVLVNHGPRTPCSATPFYKLLNGKIW